MKPEESQSSTRAGIPRSMRRVMKEVKEQERIEQFLQTARVGYLGLQDEEGTYVVPLNFSWVNGNVYFHGANAGRKFDALDSQRITVCFTVADDLGTVAHPVPAETGTAYFSAMVFGKVRLVTDLQEATAALQAMLDKYVPGYFGQNLPSGHVERYRSPMGASTAVHCLVTERVTAKEDEGTPSQMFYPGRQQIDDVKKDSGLV
jgi:nitroimidazol reductase NimA-like FMN-containing flavoprotein (pyridoxamine 5'-phosphate oxidase superfamily)